MKRGKHMLNDKILSRYVELSKFEKAIKEEREQLRAMIMLEPNHQSQLYKIQLTHSTRTSLESTKFIKELVPEIYSQLVQQGCVKQIDVTTLTVKERSRINLDGLLND